MNKAGNAIDNHAKIEFARTQSFLGSFPVVNIGKHDAPADDAALGVAQGLAAGVEPAEYAVRTAGPGVHIILVSGFKRAAPLTDHTPAVIQMGKVGPVW